MSYATYKSVLVFLLITNATPGCPPSMLMKPCSCVSSSRIRNIISVTCSFATSWLQVRKALDLIRNVRYVENLHIEAVSDYPVSNNTMHRLFRNLYVDNILITNCVLPHRLPRNMFANSTIRTLHIENVNVKRIPVQALKSLTTLQELSFADDALTSIARKSFRYVNATLKLLNLQNNNLSSVPTKALRHLSNVELLVLSNNAIVEIRSSSFVGLRKLLALELGYNKIVALIDNSFAELTSLKHLGLCGNPLTTLGQALINLPSPLVSLDIGGTDISLSVLAKKQDNCDTLETLVAPKNCKLNVTDLAAFTNLMELDLRDNKHLNVSSFDSLTTMTGVNHLDLSDTLLHISVIKRFPNLNTIYVNANKNLTKNGNGKLMLDSFINNRRLITVHFEECNIRHIDAETFLPVENSLEELNMRSNRLSRLHRRTFVRLQRLTSLDLSYNKFRDRYKNHTQFKPLNKPFFAASGRQTLTNLALAGNYLKWIPEQLLRHLTSLRYLNLAANNIENIHMELAHNYALETLKMNNNRVKYIQSDSFRHLGRLTSVNLDSNPLINVASIRFPDFVQELSLSRNKLRHFSNRSSLSTLKFLKVLNLSYNNLRTIDVESFKSSRESLLFLDLTGNPLDCSCELRPFMDWLADNTITLSPSSICWTPLSLRYKRPLKQVCWSKCTNNDDNNISSTTLNYERNEFIFCAPSETADFDDDD